MEGQGEGYPIETRWKIEQLNKEIVKTKKRKESY